MKLILKKLTLHNFKGILDMSLDFVHKTKISGANESGKSTIVTAFYWLLTGKDEFDRKDYEIKNTYKKELNRQSHEVEGVFSVDGREVTLKRVYLEDWQRPKGQSREVFKGHYTDFYVNGVKCATATEYQQKVEEIIPANILKMVTNPLFFNTLSWQDQRRGLLALAGEITTDEIIGSIASADNDFSTLLMVLNSGKKLEDYKKELAAKKNTLKKSAIEFPARIDEAMRRTPEAHDWVVLQSDIDKRTNRIKEIELVLMDSSKALTERQKGITAKSNQLFSKKQDAEKIRSKVHTDLLTQQSKGGLEITGLKNQISAAERNIQFRKDEVVRKERDIENWQKDIEQLDIQIKARKDGWDDYNSKTFSFDESSCTCPTCKQSLPADDIANKRIELQANFNNEVLSGKKKMVEEANSLKQRRAELVKGQEDARSWIDEVLSNVNDEMAKLSTLQAELSQLEEQERNKGTFDINTAVEAKLNLNGDYLNLKDEITSLEEEIKADTAALGTTQDLTAEKEEKARLQVEIFDLSKKLALRDTIAKATARVEELKKDEEATAQEIANIERQEFEVDSYSRAKMDILENRVNGKFKYVSFRLFDRQVNGGEADTCVCEYKGVPYPTLNTAAKMMAGLDVINTFSSHYQVFAPVFCDNRESVTIIPEIESQTISLFVSPADQSIRIEAA
ncbi:AAA family ATPase [Chitinophaga sancti]|uniref:AAA domain n=1 Tax=Chitinophaga sancti TaxID=1004 RepID=A0A1K1M0N5_9BACT|nr:AAA family ATPase [Chitinophaga sancti]WQD64717.1 AAA family ATPase [Chitinophaga sancti]WQG89661.1 AAA family ATPase [Chitinophaga sancti]SFW16656.1 AAA domain [Chitinophaga sancti]